jgi:hypothetical protein
VRADIALFLNAEFSKIVKIKRIEPPWPTEAQVNGLVQLSGRLFILAATAIKFISDDRFPKNNLLKFLPAGGLGLQGPHAALDSVYTKIIMTVVQDSVNDNARMLLLYRQIVGPIVVVQQPLSKSCLSRLLRKEREEVNVILEPLYSVLDIGSGEDDHTVQPFHLSFPDFLTSQERCKDDRFYIRPKAAHLTLSIECLRIMNEELKENICEIHDPGLFNSEIKDLSDRMKSKISEELGYACVYWISHLVSIEDTNEEIEKALQVLCLEHLLHWIEVLSLLHQVRAAMEGIPRAIAWYKVSMKNESNG